MKANVDSRRDPNRRIRTSLAARCLTLSNSRPATDCTKATCRGCRHHTDASDALLESWRQFYNAAHLGTVVMIKP